MSKIKKILSAFLILIMTFSLIPLSVLATPDYENLATYTEVDEDSDITLVSNYIVGWDTMRRDAVSYLYKDYGEDIDGDFILTGWFTITDMSVSASSQVTLMGVSAGVGASYPLGLLPTDAISIHAYYSTVTSKPRLRLQRNYTSSSSAYMDIEFDTDYYIKMSRSVDDVTLLVYSNIDMTDLLFTRVESVAGTGAYRNIYAMQGDGVPGANGQMVTSGGSGLLTFFNGGAPSIETIDSATCEYNASHHQYEVALSANLTDDGGGTCDVGFYYTTDNITYDFREAFDADEDSIYTSLIPFPISEKDNFYWYYAYAENEGGSNTGDVYSFTIEDITLNIPDVDTVTYTSLASGNVTLWGSIWDDGGANCTGYFYYKTAAAGSWDISSNTTGLYTSNGFHSIVTGIIEDTWYMYKAAALNSEGENEGSIMYFNWANATTPVCTTGQPINVEEQTIPADTFQATFTGNITDDGGGYCVAGFDFKKHSDSSWTRIEIGGEYYTGDNFTYTRYGLSPLTTYDYRALCGNEFTYNETTFEYTYVSSYIVSFTTGSSTSIPTLLLNDVAWWDNYTVVCDITLTSDGGHDCLINMQYRIPYQSWQNATTPDLTGVSSVSDCVTYVTGLEYGLLYEFRAYAHNTVEGGTGYSNIVSFQLVNPDDTETPGATDVKTGIDSWLAGYGLNNTGGRLLVIIAACLIVLFICVAIGWQANAIALSLIVTAIIDTIIIVFSMIIGYIPVWLTGAVMVVFAALVATKVVGLFRGDRGID